MSEVKEQIRLVSISRIDIVVQARPINDAHVKRLKQSIHDEGLKNPIVVYDRGGRFILGPGAHRLQAYVEMDLHEIPAIVRPDAPDDVIRREQAIENLQRENMTPMEEARALEKLQEDIQDLDRVAVMAGRTRKWVEQRLSFMRLSPRVQHLIDVGLLPIEHGYQIARVASPERQEEIAGMVAAAGADEKDGYRMDERAAELDDVKDLVEESLRDLNGVQWKLDVEFEGLPACSTCPHNSANHPTLFDTAEKIHRCMLPSCFADKTKLASSGVRKSVNHMNKEGQAATPKNAETAIAAREVTFVEPKAVVDYAKTVKAPSKKTSAESRGRNQATINYEIQNKYESAVREWSNKLEIKIAAKLRANPSAQSMFILLQAIPEFDNIPNGYGAEFETRTRKTDKKEVAAEAMILRLLDEFKAPSMIALARISDKVRYTGKSPDDSWPIEISLGDGLSANIREKLCNIYDIQIPTKPTLAQFQPPKKEEPKPGPAAQALKQVIEQDKKQAVKRNKPKKPAAKKAAPAKKTKKKKASK